MHEEMIHEDLNHTVRSCLRGDLDPRAVAVLDAFGRWNVPEVDAARMGELATRLLDELIGLTTSEDDRVRHLAAFCLGYSQSSRAVGPLVAMESAPGGDFFDHDFIYEACAQLGAVALDELLRIAMHGSETDRFVAVQALGQSRADAWPHLRHLVVDGCAPPGFFAAIENLCDMRALPDVWLGLQSDDAEVVGDAVSAAHALLLEARRQERVLDIDRVAWTRRFAELLACQSDDVVGFPPICLGLLQEPSALPVLEQLARQGESEGIEGLVWNGSGAARDALMAMLRTDSESAREGVVSALSSCARTLQGQEAWEQFVAGFDTSITARIGKRSR